MALMYKHAELTPMPDAAIFADTQDEPRAVYEWLDWLETQLPYPVYRVTRGNLMQSAIRVRKTRDGERSYIQTAIPVYTIEGLRTGQGQRHCTRDFKIKPIQKKARELLGKRSIRSKVPLVEMLIGISTDEFDRAKPSQQPWIVNRHPLLDEARMSRTDCIQWLQAHDYGMAPRSACKKCPFRDDEQWLSLAPDELAEAVAFEPKLQAAYAATSEISSTPYLHETRVPLGEITLSPNYNFDFGPPLNKYRNECEGMCGV
jgi:hypothetical protein